MQLSDFKGTAVFDKLVTAFVEEKASEYPEIK
jgi:hypothetical protein